MPELFIEMENKLQDALAHLSTMKQVAAEAPQVVSKPVNMQPTEKTVPANQLLSSPSAAAAYASNANPDFLYPTWDNPIDNRHNVRALCDLAGLSLDEKNIITACIEQESQFYNYLPNGDPVKHENMVNGVVASTDWGIVQCNDGVKDGHIGAGKDFPSVEYVLANPKVMVQWMIDCYKEGRISMWDSYSTGAYLKFMPKPVVQ